MFQDEVFVCEFLSVDGFATGAIETRKVSTLAHWAVMLDSDVLIKNTLKHIPSLRTE
jgi:hypothetical protein